MTRQLKVLIIPEFLVSPSGGAREFFYKILEINNSHNTETAVVLEHIKTDEYVENKCEINNARIFNIPNRIGKFNVPIYSTVYELFCYYKIIHKFNPDIIFVSNIRPGINLSVLFFSYPVIFFVHSYPTSSVPFWHYYWTRLIAHLFSNKKKQFISVSNYAVKQIIEHMKVPEKFTSVIYNSYPSYIERPLAKNENNDFIILTIGHVVSYKNPYIWLEVAEQIINQNFLKNILFISELSFFYLYKYLNTILLVKLPNCKICDHLM